MAGGVGLGGLLRYGAWKAGVQLLTAPAGDAPFHSWLVCLSSPGPPPRAGCRAWGHSIRGRGLWVAIARQR